MVYREMQRRTPAELLGDGYFCIPAELWGRLHVGDVISYVRSSTPEKSYGGKIVGVFTTDGVAKLKLRSERSPAEWCDSLCSLDEVWKKYSRGSEIEFSMVMLSLVEKNKRLTEMSDRLQELTDHVRDLESRMK
jgi:hypothetical protein